MKRYVIEGVWGGYTSSQRKICHRTVTDRIREVEHFQEVSGVLFTDGTIMYLSVRPCQPRERVPEIHGYDSLLRDIFYDKLTGLVQVDDLR